MNRLQWIKTSSRITRPSLVTNHNTLSYINQSHHLHTSCNHYNKSFIQSFRDNLRENIQKNKELQSNLKQLASDTERLNKSDGMNRVKGVLV